ncbi:MAG: hypothetical protein ISS59_01000 [Desulfobacteraceae bacterium]|nr:hypothetical protein [Desulfobacteraceae bacterium]
MRNSTEITSDIEDLKEKIESLNSETSQKKENLEELRSNNARLLAANVGKSRKPMSLHTQIERIRSMEIEIEQSGTAVKILQDQLSSLQEELHIAELNEDLQKTYWPESEAYLEKAAQIRGKMSEAVRLTEEITRLNEEFMAMADPLNMLHGIFSKLKSRKQYEALGFDWGTESEKYKMINSILQDEKKISNLQKILKHFSDIFFGVESGSPMAASKLRMVSDQIPVG